MAGRCRAIADCGSGSSVRVRPSVRRLRSISTQSTPSAVPPTDIEPPRGGVHLRAGHAPLESEARLVEHKLPMARAFARANDLDHVLIRGARRRIGIVTTGKAFADVRRALLRLGLDDERAAETGIGLYKVALSWPLEPHRLRAFASGFDELLFVEEKQPLLEQQAARLLYDLPADRRPAIVGKTDERGAPLLPSAGVLDSGSVARAIAARLDRAGLLSDDVRSRSRMTQRHLMLRRTRCRSPERRTSAPGARTTARRSFPKVVPPWLALAAATWRFGWTGRRCLPCTWERKARTGTASRHSRVRRTSSRTSVTGRTSTPERLRSGRRSRQASTSPIRSFTTTQ